MFSNGLKNDQVTALTFNIPHSPSLAGVASHVELALQHGEEPFDNISKAPQEYFDLFEDADHVEKVWLPQVSEKKRYAEMAIA